MTTKKRVLIVGAGMAGLTAAAYLARDNYQVLLLEKNDRTGGLLNTFDSGGFLFDAGPRAFVNSGIVKPMLNDLGIKGEFLQNRISIGVEDQMLYVDSMDALKEYERILAHLYPDNIADIAKIMAITLELSEYTRILYEFDNPNFVDLMADKKFIIRKLIPWTFKFLNALRKFNQFKMPMEDFLERLTDNPSLRDILAQHFFRQTPTYFVLGYFYVYLDYFYPKGGTSMLAALLHQNVLAMGGQIELNKHIVELIPSESKVIDSEGLQYEYDHLVWAADLKALYHSVNPAGLEPQAAAKIEAKAQSIYASKGAESVFIMFVAVDRPPSYFQEHGGEHMFYTPSRKGLGEVMKAEREALIEEFDGKSKQEIVDWLGDFCDLNTYEVSVPVLRDPTMAPEGKTGLMISCLFDYTVVEKIEEAGWYSEFKEIMQDRIISVFSETIYAGIEDDVLFRFSSTPLTIRQVSGSSEGAITGWSFETPIPVVSTLKDIPKSVLTAVPRVYQAGQWAYAPAGVPIAMLTGWYAAKEIMKRS